MPEGKLNSSLEREFIEKRIDRDLTFSIMNGYNNGKYRNAAEVKVSGIPGRENNSIIDRVSLKSFRISKDTFYRSMDKLLPGYSFGDLGTTENGNIVLSEKELEKIGILLYPVTSFGILNGGSATSYVDRKKNRGFNRELFSIYDDIFSPMAEISEGKAKGITPAFIQSTGEKGPSFLELKLRGLLVQALKYQSITGSKSKALFPLFQMTSTYNNSQILEELDKYSQSPYLSDLMEKTGIPITNTETGIQPLIAAFTPVESGKPIDLFTNAWGKDNSLLPLPGGHGQNFFVLKETYKKLYRDGKRFVYLGNIDNLGSTVDPVSIALLAVTGKQAAFDFSFKTPVDVKGGILVKDDRNRLNCADIGPAITKEEVARYETEGSPILFNCATGLFNLEYLTENLDYIIEKLPLRFSNQDKDAGKYSQAEQVTWEVMGLLDDFLVIAVDKYERFLAAKMLIEGILTSGLKLDDPVFKSNKALTGMRDLAVKLNAGLEKNLVHSYGLKKEDGIWIPEKADVLEKSFLNL